MSAGRRRLENAIQIGREINSRLDERYAISKLFVLKEVCNKKFVVLYKTFFTHFKCLAIPYQVYAKFQVFRTSILVILVEHSA